MLERGADVSNLSLTAAGSSDEAQTARERSKLVALRMLKLAQECRVTNYFTV